jgi:nitrogen-specific signal transduction histidine kinase
MDRHEALESLRSDATIQRLRAARVLEQQANPQDAEVIRVARDAEPDVLVRKVLDRALGVATSTPGASSAEAVILVPSDPDLADLYGKAVEDVGRFFLHEIRPLVGALELALVREEGLEYEGPLLDAIERIRGFLEAVQVLRDASAVPVHEEFDLTDFVLVTAAEEGLSEPRVLFGRNDPVIVHGDRNLLRLALANALRNARDALLGVPDEENGITVNWGSTDRDAWVVVLDRGSGLPDAYEDLKLPGTTTKSKASHDGMGLTIADRAMVSMQGTLTFSPRRERGTACEVRWPQGPPKMETEPEDLAG